MNPTIHDVAKRANVSIATVSRVVNNPQAVRTDKRERVLQVIAELGYTPNPLASGLRDKKTGTIVFVVPNIVNPFYAEMFRGIEDYANENGIMVMIFNTDGRIERFYDTMRYLIKRKPDGLIFASDPVDERYAKSFQDLGIPVVLAATESECGEWPSVKVNDRQASYDATTFLIKNGHRHIAMISGPLTDPIAGQPRYDGFLAAMHEYEMPVSDKHVEHGDTNFTFDGGYAAMGKLYARLPELTAVFAASDLMALGAMKFLQERGIEVPRHVSILGFDNLAFSRMVTPSLTSVAQPIYLIGHKAAQLLLNWIDDGEKPPSRVLEHEIVIRESLWNRR